MRKQSRPRRRSEWESLVREWRSGSLTQREFARRRGIAPTTLSWWSCRIGRDARRKKGPAFEPVRVVGAAAGGGDLRLELPGDRTLHVPARFDEGALRRLLEILESAAC